MNDIARTLVVRSVEPGISDAGRVHAVVTVRDPAGIDGALHLFTSDPALAACLVAGAELELRVAADRRCSSCRWCGTEEVFRSDATTRECLNPNLGAEPMAEPGACFGGVAVEPTFGCLQWEAKLPRG